ncbi:plasmid replication protein RepC [Paracoccus aminophilus]|uniref:Replication protein C n=1 Tax=Paracoccus aminophilus JCM 7686 TaxID=1367847 RepID=S5Y222_PARAH|nr:plasmid replication protein RepC [Paracoccus aminophilus]AGT11502.1 replication protein C [Paracoccus aminophilus JCM 7686]
MAFYSLKAHGYTPDGIETYVHEDGLRQSPAHLPASRWQLLRSLVLAKDHFGLTDRDLTVLQALLSCLPGDDRRFMTAFASNATLSSRTQGMHERTLRRHLAALIDAGIIVRRDSPNRKRYARRSLDGEIQSPFGFDLTPLFARHAEIEDAARTEEASRVRIKTLREELSLIRNEIKADPNQLVIADAIRKALKRKLTEAELIALRDKLGILLARPNSASALHSTEEMSGAAGQNVRHIQESQDYLNESEGELLTKSAQFSNPVTTQQASEGEHTDSSSDAILPTLGRVCEACPSAMELAQAPIHNWYELERFSWALAPMIGVTHELMGFAERNLGRHARSVVILYIVERISRIRSPGAYLRSLCKKAQAGLLSPSRLIAGLTREHIVPA